MQSSEAQPISWHDLQEVLRECTTEDQVAKLMEKEKNGPNRLRWLVRMQGRLRVLRTERENAELTATQQPKE